MRFRRPLLFGLIAALFSMMALAPGCGPKTVRTGHRGVEGTLKDIRFFAYQIQSQEEGNNVRKLADSRYDMLVIDPVSYTHLRAHETRHDLVCRLLLEKKKKRESRR